MHIIFFTALFIIGYIFLGYPVILFLISRIFEKKVNQKDIEPYVSLIISAYNEEKIIEEKILNALSLDYPKDKLEIIVASESTDGTHDIVRRYAKDSVVLVAYKNREGKRATLFKTVPQARGSIIIFSDANAMYDKQAIRMLVRNFNDNRIGCVSGRLRYKNRKGSSVGKGEALYWEHDFILKNWLSRIFTMAGAVNGSILALRKELYDPIDKNRGDDFEISCRVEIKGFGVVMDPEAISYEETSEKSTQEFSRKVRMASWNLKSALILLGEAVKNRRYLTAYLLISHRVLRYTMPLWLISLFISNVFLVLSGSAWIYPAILQIVFYTVAVVGWYLEFANKKLPLLILLPFYFCLVNMAALIALWNNLFRKEEFIWQKMR